MKVCPYCDQDDLWRVSIAGVDGNPVMCAECDTVWKHDEEIEYGNGRSFDDFMADRGSQADWKAIEWQLKL